MAMRSDSVLSALCRHVRTTLDEKVLSSNELRDRILGSHDQQSDVHSTVRMSDMSEYQMVHRLSAPSRTPTVRSKSHQMR